MTDFITQAALYALHCFYPALDRGISHPDLLQAYPQEHHLYHHEHYYRFLNLLFLPRVVPMLPS